MKEYRVVSNGKTLIEKVVANSMEEVGLLVAVNFGDEYFGCNIIQNSLSLTEEQIKNKWGTDFTAIAVKEYYEEDGKIANPVEIAAKAMTYETRKVNGFYKTTWDRGDECRNFNVPIK